MLTVENNYVYAVEVHNNKTLEHEVIAYLTDLSDARRKAIEQIFYDALTDDEDYSLRIYIYDANWDNIQIVMEALNFVRE